MQKFFLKSDGKRPEGLTLIPWCEDISATWDVTVIDTVADSYEAMLSISAESAAEEMSGKCVNEKYLK